MPPARDPVIKPEIDFKFISALEGGQRLKGYVPDPGNSQSGVTIATGFDLGARKNLREFKGHHRLVMILSKYLGLKSERAKWFLDRHPLVITKEQADIIDRVTQKSLEETLILRYNHAISKGDLHFKELPSEAQTVIASVAFQYGDLATETTKFWKKVTAQNWPGAHQELLHFDDKYSTRRKKEAALLQKIL